MRAQLLRRRGRLVAAVSSLVGLLGVSTLPLSAGPAAADALPLCVQAVPIDCPWPTQYTGLPRPQTIPALRTWAPGIGQFQLGAKPRIIVGTADAPRLSSDAQLFAADLTSVTGRAARVVVTDKAPNAGDVTLQLGAGDAALGAEGYELTTGSVATIKANESAGAFYGTRTVLQLLKQSTTIAAGSSRDWPRYPQRGFMIDVARNFYSYDWLAARIREMAYLKLNYLHLHFSDDQGWAIESNEGLQSPQYLTKQQVRDLVALAARHHVVVVPEIDMPSHMGWALRAHPEFQLKDTNGVAVPDKVDYTIPAAREWLRSLINEYLPLFPGTYWDMGADEYLADTDYPKYPQLLQYAQQQYGPLATVEDGYHGLINDMNAMVRAQGKTLRIWNDSLTPDSVVVPVDKNVVVDWWTDLRFGSTAQPLTPAVLLAQGYTVLNASFYPTYDYNPSDTPTPPSVQHMYEDWAVQRFHGYVYNIGTTDGSPETPFMDVDPSSTANLGSQLNYWNDGATPNLNESQTAAEIYPRLRVMAQKTWESGPLVTDWASFQTVVDNVGTAPN